MKNLPAPIALTGLAALVLLAVVSSVIDSVPVVLIATYIVSAASSLGFIGVFLGDYADRSPQIDLSPKEERQTRVQPGYPEAHEVAPVAPRDFFSTMGIHNDPATVSYT